MDNNAQDQGSSNVENQLAPDSNGTINDIFAPSNILREAISNLESTQPYEDAAISHVTNTIKQIKAFVDMGKIDSNKYEQIMAGVIGILTTNRLSYRGNDISSSIIESLQASDFSQES